ncbi:glutathione S-transferase family protein [Phenylobacterium conjunctum]|uniref:Glutathione S-transferase family protein n=1 Tax=Phenylobacterium conjunctum TaxID=1298959 RepID=A0ABW3SYD6_9CAUL
MSTIVLHTDARSPYGWACALIADEKGVPFEIVGVDVASPAHRRLHPFGKMPVLQHGEVIVYEALAIAHYIDRAFAGPVLQPLDPLNQARMLTAMSVVSAYCFPTMNGLIKERTAGLWRDTPTDPAVVESFVAPLTLQLEIFEESLSRHPFLVGEHLSLADLFLLPHLHLASATPEGATALGHAPSTAAWLAHMRARPSFDRTNPYSTV